MKLRIVTLLIVCFSASCAVGGYTVVKNGSAFSVRNEGSWKQRDGYIEVSGNNSYLFPVLPVNGGDVEISAILSIENLHNSNAAFTLNEDGRTENVIIFSKNGQICVNGRYFGTQDVVEVAPAEKYITEGEKFLFQVHRKNKKMSFSINCMQLWQASKKCRADWLGEPGFRAGEAAIRIYDYEIDGEILSMHDYLLNMPQKEIERIESLETAGIMELSPVALPAGANLRTNNWHFGWPVSMMQDDTICVFFSVKHDHHGSGRVPDENVILDAMIRSTDRGQSWSSIIDMSEYKPDGQNTIAGMRAVGVIDGTMYFAGRSGVYRSESKGETWQYLENSFTPAQISHKTINYGPSIVKHEDYGLLMALNNSKELQLFYSRDKGETWKVKTQQMEPELRVHGEPTIIEHKGALIMLARAYGSKAYNENKKLFSYSQFWSEDGSLPFKYKLTNIHTTDIAEQLAVLAGERKSKAFGFWSQDTTDLIYNPFTKRLEAVITNRTGGGPGNEKEACQSLNLWSISPEALLAGDSEWRFEGTLLKRRTFDSAKFFDGMHPAGTSVDLKNKKQHIFVYLGYYNGPTGIFQLTRTLDTPEVSVYLKQY